MEHERSDDRDIERLRAKTKKGAANVVNEVLADPEVQALIKGALLRETVKTSILMACLFVGVLKLYDVAKTVVGFDWKGDFVIGLLLTLIGLIYMLKNISNGKPSWSQSDK
jgi:hypothetical protein